MAVFILAVSCHQFFFLSFHFDDQNLKTSLPRSQQGRTEAHASFHLEKPEDAIFSLKKLQFFFLKFCFPQKASIQMMKTSLPRSQQGTAEARAAAHLEKPENPKAVRA